MTAKSIEAIDKGSVHRICSGQVVLNLATAVKELVENSLDAAASVIDIRLKEYGSELVEVVDNGSGVEPANFQGLTLKHHTSKLKDFSDIVNVETFGFRGEALSSLCALSKLTITTCHKNEAVGSRLEYNHSGNLISETHCARQPGTTTTLEQLFSTLPVRYKEFQRNVRREYAKAVQVLSAYCLISTGVKITCSNQVGKGKKTIVVSTGGNSTVKENITNVFGAKQMQSVLPFEQASPSDEVAAEYGIKPDQTQRNCFTISGYVSSSEHGQGRGSTDRQFFFINKRPCDHQKVSRVVNEVYHMYNKHQYPFVMMDISLNKDSVDVNVTPDKRQIFIQEERMLLATLKTSLAKLFEPRSSLYQLQQPASQKITGALQMTNATASKTQLSAQWSCPVLPSEESPKPSLSNLKRSFSSAFARASPSGGHSPSVQQQPKQRRLDQFVSSKPLPMYTTQGSGSPRAAGAPSHATSDAPSDTPSDAPSNTGQGCEEERVPSSDSQTSGIGSSYSSPRASTHAVSPSSGVCIDSPSRDHCDRVTPPQRDGAVTDEDAGVVCALDLADFIESKSPHASPVNGTSDTPDQSFQKVLQRSPDVVRGPVGSAPVDLPGPEEPTGQSPSPGLVPGASVGTSGSVCSGTGDGPSQRGATVLKESCPPEPAVSVGTSGRPSGSTTHRQRTPDQDPARLKVIYTEFDEAEARSLKTATALFSLSQIATNLQRRQRGREDRQCRSFRAKITPGDNKSAEDELRKEIKKEMFAEMKVLGQFNLGFIIGQLGQDLFIIDQHATDEKYNFEMLQRHTVIQSQKLIQPQCLELTAANEITLIDNLEVFRKNGFDFLIDEEALPTQRVKLLSMPTSKNWTFDKNDIEELVFMLSDTPGVMCRPSRVRLMFASRACRKSVMIGTALNAAEMRKLVSHMGQIDQPWNCPHGRPTMRHLINLDMLPD